MTPTKRTVPAEARGVAGWVAAIAVAGTVVIAAGAFWLSFTTLADLARRSGAARGWVWPIIVDGVIVVATIAVVALAPDGPRATRYPWILLFACASVSVAANALHALVSDHTGIPVLLAAAVAAVPPLILLAITHLTVELTRRTRPVVTAPATSRTDPVAHGRSRTRRPPSSPGDDHHRRGHTGGQARAEAGRLRARGWTNRRIAAHLGVHPSTVGRWFSTDDGPSHATRITDTDAETTPHGLSGASAGDGERSHGSDAPVPEREEA